MDQQRAVSRRPSMDVPFRPSTMSMAPLSPSGYELVPGRNHNIEAMEQRFPAGDAGHSTSSPRNIGGRNYHEGGYTVPASSSPAAPHHSIERASSSITSSLARDSPFTTPAGSPASIGEDLYDEDVFQGHAQRSASAGPPANAPKGPSGRQQRSNYSATRQNGPPPNAPTGPAAMRKQDQRRKKWQLQQQPTYLTEGKASYSITWKAPGLQLQEDFETYKKHMNIMGVQNESRAPSFEEYKLLRTYRSNRSRHFKNMKNAAGNAIREAGGTRGNTDMVLGEEIRKLQEEKLVGRDLFPPFFVEMWWDRAVPAVGGNIWPSVADQKRVGDGNKSRSAPRSLCSPPENRAEQDGGDANRRDKPANYFIRPAQEAISADGSLATPTGDPEPNRESWYPRELIDFIDEDTDSKIQEELDQKKRQVQEKETESGEEAWRKYFVE